MPQDTTKAFSPSVQSQGHRASFVDVLRAFSDKQNSQLDELGRALKAQIKTQSNQINQLLQALTTKVAENGVRIDQVLARVDQLGTRIDRIEERLEMVENPTLRRRQAPYSRPPTCESKDSVSFPDDYTTK